MYVVRRGDRWWFRKAVPVDLVDVLGIAEIRRSLRTGDARVARRRALDVLVRVEEVYAVLRSERPLRPARDVALAMLEGALGANSGMPETVDLKDGLLREASAVLRRTGDGDLSVGRRNGFVDLPDPESEPTTLVVAEDALRLLQQERPKGEENRIAVAILQAVARMSLGRLQDTNAGARDLDAALSMLSTLRERNAAPVGKFPFEELRALLATHLSPREAPDLDAQAVREMVASELRDGIARAQAEKWSGTRASNVRKGDGTGTSRMIPVLRFLRQCTEMVPASASRSAWVRLSTSVIRPPVQASARHRVSTVGGHAAAAVMKRVRSAPVRYLRRPPDVWSERVGTDAVRAIAVCPEAGHGPGAGGAADRNSQFCSNPGRRYHKSRDAGPMAHAGARPFRFRPQGALVPFMPAEQNWEFCSANRWQPTSVLLRS